MLASKFFSPLFDLQTDLVAPTPFAMLHQGLGPGDKAIERIHPGGKSCPYRYSDPNKLCTQGDVGFLDKQPNLVSYKIQLVFINIQSNDQEFVAFPPPNKVKKPDVIAYGLGNGSKDLISGALTSIFNIVGIILVMVTRSRSMVERTKEGSKSSTTTCFPPTHVMAKVAQASAR